ncbi:hypothetical protein CAPTEDRAFT_188322 [Capitella teleta]|uniref:Uncharacterized protein n=1 Tax=Capitella teleta TaxID=283909 RepID=R7VLQ5_CAPTE|nr:hypothetical protein CAPTEDRAFT_188322 [Capitella teleta]|eukprot:ELU18486.1 hypothetical protein CAPTEDRAFT_188322 [Capitella teleta]
MPQTQETVPRQFQRRLRIPSLRKESLTGSLPDLTNLSQYNLTNSPRKLPEGSEAFQAALKDIKGDKDTAKKPPVPNIMLGESQLAHKFRSRTAQVICMNRFMMTYPKYMERLVDGRTSGSAPTTPTSENNAWFAAK